MRAEQVVFRAGVLKKAPTPSALGKSDPPLMKYCILRGSFLASAEADATNCGSFSPYRLILDRTEPDILHVEQSRGSQRACPAKAPRKSGVQRRGSGRARCPSDTESVAEANCMGKLAPQRAQQFTEHCANCPKCARQLQHAREFIRTIRAALAENPPFLIFHCPPVVFRTDS